MNSLPQDIPLQEEDFEYFRARLEEISGIFLSENKSDLVKSRLRSRIDVLGLSSFTEYRHYLSALPPAHEEWQLMLNEMTTNKTDFFREPSHFDYLIEKFLPDWEKRNKGNDLRVWSAACATGEEPYSMAMVLQRYFKGSSRFKITASDIDTNALGYASNGVYPKQRLEDIPVEFIAGAVDFGRGDLSGWGKIKTDLSKKIEFLQVNLTDRPYPVEGPFDVIFCRNVFIYFHPETIEQVIQSLYDTAAEGALLVTGRSETLQNLKNPWQYIAPSIFQKARDTGGRSKIFSQQRVSVEAESHSARPNASLSGKSRVLIVDDSKTVTQLLAKILSQDPGLEVVAQINNPLEIEAAIQKFKPNVMTLDIHMPVMDGCAVLENLLPKYPIPTVMISSISMQEGPAVLRALELGAVDYIQKPSFSELHDVKAVIIEKIKNAAGARIQRARLSSIRKQFTNLNDTVSLASTLVAIGSSTGGTEALTEILTQLPSNIPPILIVQHIPPVFSKAFADRLNGLCLFEVKEAENGDEVKSGRVLIAPGGKHMLLHSRPGGLIVKINDEPPINRHKPSVDVLFDSVCQLGKNSIGIILTGMGGDGSKGLLKMRQAGAKTIAQDEKSCVVFGMPREAIRLGAASEISSLEDIPSLLISWLKK